MSGNFNSGRPSPAYLARMALDELAEEVARLLLDEAGAKARCVIELVRASSEDIPGRLDGARWGPRGRKPPQEPRSSQALQLGGNGVKHAP